MDMERFTQKYEELLDGISFGAFQTVKITPDEKLYHYTSLAGLQGILDSGVFRATEYHYLNDEDEFTYVDQLLLEIIDEEFQEMPYYKDLKFAFAEDMLGVRIDSEEVENSFYVVSFSMNPDNLTLWTEFASFGCNMGVLPFDMFSDTSNIIYHGPVIYDRAEQKKRIKLAIRTVLSHFTEKTCEEDEGLTVFFNDPDEQEIRLLADAVLKLVVYYGMAMKDSLYEAEHEYRLIFAPNGKKVDYRLRGSLLIPYIELPLKTENHFTALKSVTLAPLNKTLLHKRSMLQFLYSKGCESVQVGQSQLNLRY